jgi:hypothetical protein
MVGFRWRNGQGVRGGSDLCGEGVMAVARARPARLLATPFKIMRPSHSAGRSSTSRLTSLVDPRLRGWDDGAWPIVLLLPWLCVSVIGAVWLRRRVRRRRGRG